MSMPTRACEDCNRKKTKCDMRHPQCGLCQRTGRICKFPTTRRLPRASSKRTASRPQVSRGNLNWAFPLLGDYEAPNATFQTDRLPTTVPEELLSVVEDSIKHQSEGPGVHVTTPTRYDSELRAQSRSTTGLDSMPLEQNLDTQCRVESPRKLANTVVVPQIPHALALHLVELFFAHIQPWLPLLHKPRFMAWCRENLKLGSDALADVSQEDRLLLFGIFGLAARFSSHPSFEDTNPKERSSQYIKPARQVYGDLRGQDRPTLLYLQGCIVLAFDAYTDELNSGAWILTGVCIRLAYDLGLAEIDGGDEHSLAGQAGSDHVELEEMRRAWWLIWELDTFASVTNRKPFAVHRHDFSVKLPLSDDHWFAGENVDSAELVTAPSQAWKTLQNSKNQNSRAWFLIAYHLVPLLVQHLQKRRSGHDFTQTEFTTGFKCLKLAWPDDSISSQYARALNREHSLSEIGYLAHLLVIAAYGMIDSMGDDRDRAYSPVSRDDPQPKSTAMMRAVSFSQVIARWPPDYMAAAHPVLVWSVMPTTHEIRNQSPESLAGLFEAVGDTAEQIMARFARKWKLAGHSLAVFRLLRDPSHRVSDTDLRRRFAAYLTRESATHCGNQERKSPHNDGASFRARSVADTNALPRQQASQQSDELVASHAHISSSIRKMLEPDQTKS